MKSQNRQISMHCVPTLAAGNRPTGQNCKSGNQNLPLKMLKQPRRTASLLFQHMAAKLQKAKPPTKRVNHLPVFKAALCSVNLTVSSVKMTELTAQNHELNS